MPEARGRRILFVLAVIAVGIAICILGQWRRAATPSPFTLRRVLPAHADFAYDLAFSPQSDLLATVGRNERTVKIWRVRDGKLLRTFQFKTVPFPSPKPLSVAFSPDGQLLAVGFSDGKVQLLRVADGKMVRALRLKGSGNYIWRLAFSPDGQWLLGGLWHKVALWRVKDGKLMRTFGDAYTMTGGNVAFAPDGQRIVTAKVICLHAFPNLTAAHPHEIRVSLWQVETGQRETITAPIDTQHLHG